MRLGREVTMGRQPKRDEQDIERPAIDVQPRQDDDEAVDDPDEEVQE
jgi:hypothetical protein